MESKEQYKQTNKTETDSGTENRLMVARGDGGGRWGEKDKRMEKYRLVVTEQSWGWKVHHREYSQ